VGDLLEPLLGFSVSAGQVSRITRRLETEVRAWHERRLEDRYQYLILDGVWLRSRSVPSLFRERRGRSRAVLAAYGIRTDGRRELIDFRVGPKESAAAWRAFLGDLFRRGVRGANLSLIVSDGGSGLPSAVEEVYFHVPRQRCWFHKMQNVSGRVRAGDRKACVGGLRKVYRARTRREAEGAYRAWGRRWRELYPEAVRCVDRDLEALLQCFTCPEGHRSAIRTTNAIERCFREVRRRTDAIGSFMDDGSIHRILYALFQHQNARYAARPSWCLNTKTLAA
jgi:transposase-like protein